MARESDWLTEWAHIAQWFVFPVSIAGWFLVIVLTYVFGAPIYGHPNGYMRILLLRDQELHEYVPPWLAYFYNSVSVLVILNIALLAICWIVKRDRPQP